MFTTIYLTASEKNVLLAFADETLLDGWKIEEETSQAYETEADLKARAQMAKYTYDPDLKSLMDKARNGEESPNMKLADFALAEKGMPEFFFTIGAKGIAMLMEVTLKKMSVSPDDEGIEALAGLSVLRHQILEVNSSVSYV